jgi:dephospho-CoA kinase
VNPTFHEDSGSRPAAAATTVLGVLGGIASGKSHVARLLAGPAGLVIDADRLVDEVYAQADFRRRVREHFGPQCIRGNAVDLSELARIAFSDPDARKKLEGWIHPGVRERILEQLGQARATHVPRVVVDVPLLLENEHEHQLAAQCGILVFVDAPREQREARAMAARGWQPGELARREATQMPLDQKRARADHVLQNHGTVAELEAAVRSLLVRLGLA